MVAPVARPSSTTMTMRRRLHFDRGTCQIEASGQCANHSRRPAPELAIYQGSLPWSYATIEPANPHETGHRQHGDTLGGSTSFPDCWHRRIGRRIAGSARVPWACTRPLWCRLCRCPAPGPRPKRPHGRAAPAQDLHAGIPNYRPDASGARSGVCHRAQSGIVYPARCSIPA